MKADHFLYKKGMPADKIYFVESGFCGFVLEDSASAIFAIAEEDDILGISDFVQDNQSSSAISIRKHSVICMSKWCEFISLDCSDFASIVDKFSDISEMLLADV